MKMNYLTKEHSGRDFNVQDIGKLSLSVRIPLKILSLILLFLKKFKSITSKLLPAVMLPNIF